MLAVPCLFLFSSCDESNNTQVQASCGPTIQGLSSCNQVLDYHQRGQDRIPEPAWVSDIECPVATCHVWKTVTMNSTKVIQAGCKTRHYKWHGPLIARYDNNDLAFVGGYCNGCGCGFWRSFYNNGQILAEGMMCRGLACGQWKQYDEAGRIRKTSTFKACPFNCNCNCFEMPDFEIRKHEQDAELFERIERVEQDAEDGSDFREQCPEQDSDDSMTTNAEPDSLQEREKAAEIEGREGESREGTEK
ncbi:MAG: hypothetical protein GXP49_10975 [Deltaproteobacteria bacterium]|nr:hypothetical protein [Deltaproteobacteria bacterium]